MGPSLADKALLHLASDCIGTRRNPGFSFAFCKASFMFGNFAELLLTARFSCIEYSMIVYFNDPRGLEDHHDSSPRSSHIITISCISSLPMRSSYMTKKVTDVPWRSMACMYHGMHCGKLGIDKIATTNHSYGIMFDMLA